MKFVSMERNDGRKYFSTIPVNQDQNLVSIVSSFQQVAVTPYTALLETILDMIQYS